MTKYKIGDKVRIVRCLDYTTGEGILVDRITPYIEKELTATIVHINTRCYISDKGDNFLYELKFPNDVEGFTYFCDREIKLAKIENWKDRIK